METFRANAVLETLPRYLDRVNWTGTVIIFAYGRHSPADVSDFLSLVDRLVLADERFSGTLDSLFLIVFHAKVCLDVGQPQKGFLCNRRGTSLAQTMVNRRLFDWFDNG